MKQAFAFTEQTKNVIGAGVVGLLLAATVAILFSSQITCAVTNTGGSCANNGGHTGDTSRGGESTGRVNNNNGGTRTPPPPPRPCTLTLSAPVVATGTQSMTLSWTPRPNGRITLQRSSSVGGAGTVNITVPNGASSYTDAIANLPKGTYTYSLRYGGSVLGVSTSTIESENANAPTTDENPVSSFGETVRQIVYRFAPVVHAEGGNGSGDSGAYRSVNVNSNSSNSNRSTSYSCSASFKIVAPLTECNDEKDNADTEDSLADRFDPGCHTDGNPNNSSSYNPLDPSEVNGPADMVPSINATSRTKVRLPISVTAGAENVASTSADSNMLVYGWRNLTGSQAPSCGRGSQFSGNRCFTQNGKTYQTLGTYNQSYTARQKRTAPVRSFRPNEVGRYEVCAVVDYTNVITEGTAGERNNVACTTVTVDPEDSNTPPPPGPTITGPIEIIVSPGRVRKGFETTISWNTNGREQCVITGTNGHVIDLTGTSSAASEPTPPITSETTYVMECADDGARAEGKVGILPQIQEI